MKRFLSLLCCLICLLPLASCDSAEANPSLSFSPLFRVRIPEGAAGSTLLASCPLSEGVLYLHPSDVGTTGGFVSASRSASAEAILSEESAVSRIRLIEKQRDLAFVLTDTALHSVSLLSASVKTALPERFSAEDALFFDSLSLMTVSDGLVLLYPIDFSETFVLADTARLPDFASLLAVSEHGKRIWYAKGSKGAYTGLAFFEYGSNLPLGGESFSFTSFTNLGGGAVLFTRALPDGGALYTYRNFSTGVIRSLSSDTLFDAVTVDPAGTVLCGLSLGGGTPSLRSFSLTDARALGTHEILYGSPAPSLALSSDARTLTLAVSNGSDLILGTLDLSPYFS